MTINEQAKPDGRAYVMNGDDFTLTIDRTKPENITITGEDCKTVIAEFVGHRRVVMSTRAPCPDPSAHQPRLPWHLRWGRFLDRLFTR